MRAMKTASRLLFLLALGCADDPAPSSGPVRVHYYSIGPN